MNNFWKSFLCVFACIFLCVASFFTGYFFRDTVRIQQDNSLSAVSPADVTVSSFSSSNFPVYLTTFFGTGMSTLLYESGFIFVRFDLTITGSNIYIGDSVNYRLINYNMDNWEERIISSVPSVDPDNSSSSTGKVYMLYRVETGFNYNPIKFTVHSDTSYYGDTDYRTTYITFIDTNNKTFSFQFCFYDRSYSYDFNMFNYRTYYYLLTDDVVNNSYYNQGFDAGYNQGNLDGSQTGYNSGYNVGFNDGKIVGYEEGVLATQDYTFSGLMTAVVEAPVNVLISLLDFNIMGYNLLSLVIGLLTLAVVVLVIKLCLGGK